MAFLYHSSVRFCVHFFPPRTTPAPAPLPAPLEPIPLFFTPFIPSSVVFSTFIFSLSHFPSTSASSFAMDLKKADRALPLWDAQTEQDIFGNQAPYATSSHTATALASSTHDSATSIYQAHPYRPNTTRSPQSSFPYPGT